MTKQEALEILDWIPTKGDEVDAMEMAIEALRMRWIPCSERLPEEGNTTYMTTVDCGKLGRGVGQRFFYGKNIGWEDDAVVAWMPLPEPYKGDTDGQP